jgi:hypothetical protein
MGFQADARAAAVELLTDFALDEGIALQVYPARPRSIHLPTAFVESVAETISYPTAVRQRNVTVEVIVLHALFDGKSAADQKDAFVDGFLDWVDPLFHAAGANTMFAAASTADVPDYVTDWFPADQVKSYYATRILLEGFAAGR